MVKEGGNAFGVMLGNGMYNNVGPRYHKWTGSAGPRTLALMLTIDGKQTLVSETPRESKCQTRACKFCSVGYVQLQSRSYA